SSVDGILFDKNKTTIVSCPGGYGGHFDIPSTVNNIGDYAFYGCTSLTSVTIGDSVTSIGYGAFYGCTSLTSVTIGDSVTSIPDWAFSWCFGLTSVMIGDSVTSIGDHAFTLCPGLSSVTIPDSVISIGDEAFSWCSGLIDVFFKGNAPLADDSVFIIAEPTIYYLEGTTGWGETFARRPTAVWYLDEPEVFIEQMTLDSTGVRFSVVGPAGRTVSVQACTDVAAGEWGELGTYSLDESGAYAFTDPAWADFPSRFYRAVLIE
ncbi:MAG: leucine-rich repeat domain-containing protein, partial [Verrucomicrobiota bacterium]|nr:leucine-rich repeat domain-containing protein [Verrucomicrobiota bacterium]